MSSEIRVNKINNRVGLGTVSFTDTGPVVSGVVTATTFSGSGASLTNLPVPTTITVADESSDTTCNPLFVTTTSGNLAPKTGTNLTFNSSSGALTATSFSGSGENLTNLTASQLIGPLPAISGANLIGIDGSKFGGGATGIQTVSNLGIQTANITAPDLVGAASSLVGLYIGDGSLLFSNNLSRAGGYYIATDVNALNAGPLSLNTTLTLDGTWVIV